MTPNSQPDLAHSQNPALKTMLENRQDLAETRLAVTATQIVERLLIRSRHLKQLMAEELEVDSKLLQIHEVPGRGSVDMLGLESQLEQQSSQIRSAQRREDVECWRDLTHVMRDFLNAWEGFSRNEAKNRFLSALPDSKPQATALYHNDRPQDFYPVQHRQIQR